MQSFIGMHEMPGKGKLSTGQLATIPDVGHGAGHDIEETEENDSTVDGQVKQDD